MTDAPMTMESAIAAVQAMDAPPEAAQTVQTEQNAAEVEETGGEIVSEETSQAEAEGATDEESDEQTAEAAPAVEAPPWWDAEAKAHFSSLTPEAQAIVRAQEGKREAVVSKAKETAKAETDAARQAVDRAKVLADQLAEAIPDQRKQFDAYYADIDWPAYAEQDPAAAQRDWFKYQQGLQAFNDAETRRAEAEKLWRDNFLREESAKLREIAPDLVEKPESLRAVADFLIGTGIPAERLGDVGALEWSLARDAMLYRKMMAEAKTTPVTPPKIPQPATAKIPPTGAVQQRAGTSQQRDVQQSLNRLRQTKSRDDAAAYILKAGL